MMFQVCRRPYLIRYIPQTAPQLNVLTLVLSAAFGTSCIHCYELSGIVSLILHKVLCLSHLCKTDVVYSSVAYSPDFLNELLAGKPTIRQGIIGMNTTLPHALEHPYGGVHLAHTALLIPLIRWVLFHASLGESAAECLLAKFAVPLSFQVPHG